MVKQMKQYPDTAHRQEHIISHLNFSNAPGPYGTFSKKRNEDTVTRKLRR